MIAQRTGITVVGDFRPADVAPGGNETPCTCTYDSIMLRPMSGAGKWRFAINVGGMSSMTFVPPWPVAGADESQVPYGLDPGLGVFFMDLTVRALNPSLELLMVRWQGAARSTRLRWQSFSRMHITSRFVICVGPDDFLEGLWHTWRATAQAKGVADIHLLATLTELTARQIAIAAARFGGANIAKGATDDVLLRGRACANSSFVERVRVNLEEQLQGKIHRIKTLDDLGVDKDSWEAAMYAMFGLLCINNIFNFQPSCTGATWPTVGGNIAWRKFPYADAAGVCGQLSIDLHMQEP